MAAGSSLASKFLIESYNCSYQDIDEVLYRFMMGMPVMPTYVHDMCHVVILDKATSQES